MKLKFKVVLLVATVSASFYNIEAMEQQNVDMSSKEGELAEQPLKFKINKDPFLVEDEQGSQLILEFRSAIGNIDEANGAQKDRLEKQLTTVTNPDSVNNLLENLKKSRERLFNSEPFLQEILQAIYNQKEQSYGGVDLSIPDFEFLRAQPLEDFLKLDLTRDKEANEKKGFIVLHIKGPLPKELHSKIESLQYVFAWNNFANLSRLRQIQSGILGTQKTIFTISTQPESKEARQLKFILTGGKGGETDEALLLRLKEKLDRQISDKDSRISLLAPAYMMAKIIMAFQEEVSRHRLQEESPKEVN